MAFFLLVISLSISLVCSLNFSFIKQTSSALQWLALGWKSFWIGFRILIRILKLSLHWSLVYPCSKFWLFILTNVLPVLTCPLEDFILQFGISVLVWIWLLIFDTPLFSILILKVPRRCMFFKSWLGLWRTLEVLNWGWHLDLDLDMVTGLWCIHVPHFGSLSWFWRFKEHPCPLSPDLELWRTLEVPDWCFSSRS